MSRIVRVAAAQMGPTQRAESREHTLQRLAALLESAAAQGAPPSLGGGVPGMLICNDRRWPEAWRVLGLQGVEMLPVGYDSAAYDLNGGTIGGSCIVDPNGLVVAEAATLGDEVLVADSDLDLCRQGKEKMFHFAAHRRPDQYRRIVDQAGAVPPGPAPAARAAE